MFCMPRSVCRISTLLLSAFSRAVSSGRTMVLGRSAPSPQVATMLWSASKEDGAKETTGKALTRHWVREREKPDVVEEEAPHVLDGVELVAVAAEVVLVGGGDDVESALLEDVAEVDKRVSLGRGRVEQHGGPPVLGVVLIAVQLEQELAGGVIEERLGDVAPLLPRRREREVDEDHHQTQHADQRLATSQRGRSDQRPGEVEHDGETQQPAQEGNLPRARFETRAEVGRAGDAQHEGREIHQRVRETEEVRHQRRNHLFSNSNLKPTVKSPMKKHTSHTKYISKMARRGSSPFPSPFPNHPNVLNTWSRASACSTRAPPMNDPSAAEKPTMEMPITAIPGQKATSWKTVSRPASVSWGKPKAARVKRRE